jgi:hypothetical protein
MRGGGSYDEYCPLCGLPFSLATVHKFKVDVEWLFENVGFDKELGLKFNLGSYDDYGRLDFSDEQTRAAHTEIDKLKKKKFKVITQSGPMEREEYPIQGYVFHKACLKVYERASGLVTDTTNVEEVLTAAGCSHPYQEQFYEWETAIETEGDDFFESPLVSIDAKNYILECCGLGRNNGNNGNGGNNNNSNKANKNNTKKGGLRKKNATRKNKRSN